MWDRKKRIRQSIWALRSDREQTSGVRERTHDQPRWRRQVLTSPRAGSRQRPLAILHHVVLVWIGLLVSVLVPTCFANDEPSSPLELQVLDVASDPPNVLLTRLNTPLKFYLRVSNRSSEELKLSLAQLSFRCDDVECKSRSVRSDELLDGPTTLAPDQSLDGWVSFHVRRTSTKEPRLGLTWKIGESTQIVSINRAIRDLINARTTQVGYDGRITVLAIDRTIDLMTMWVLEEQLRSLKAQGVERVVVDANLAETERLSPRVISWLKLANGRVRATRRGMPRHYPPPPQFREFHVTGFQYENDSPGQVMHRSREMAVRAAARTLYEHLSMEDAMVELQSPESGIRRVALENTIDRLPPDDLREILSAVQTGYAAERQLLLEMLDRVSSPIGVQTLHQALLLYLEQPQDRSDSITPATAAVAARTLIRCIVPQTERLVRDVWKKAVGDEHLRSSMVDEVLRTADHRWTFLASDFAAGQLERFSPEERGDPTLADGKTQVVVSRNLRKVIQFLHGNDREFVDVARKHVLEVTVPAVQDEILVMVIDDGDIALARDCIQQRLESGAVTRALLTMIRQLPDSQWTMRLQDLYGAGRLSHSDKVPALMTALRCATDEQLDLIIDQADDLGSSVRPYLFQQLILMNHPRCVELLKRSLEKNDSEFSRALRYLPSSESPEMLQLVLDRYEVYRRQAAEGSLKGSSFRLAQQLLAHLGPIDHPEARRMINLSLISPNAGLRREAAHQQTSSYSRTRLRTGDLEAQFRTVKRQGNYDEARAIIDTLIRHDPFCADFLMYRASLQMRSDEIASARQDVQEANRLSPGDVFIESTLALLRVRSGEIEAGLTDAEAVLIQVPTSADSYYDNTLYNTACVYSRATEHASTSADQVDEYRDRAIFLLQQSAEAGFYDEAHTLRDPDLTVLHDHPEWPAVIRKITSNKRPRR